MKRFTLTVEAFRLSLADVHLALDRAREILTRDVNHVLPPTRIGFGERGISGSIRIGEPPSEVRTTRARLEGAITEIERVARSVAQSAATSGTSRLDEAVVDLRVVADLLRKELS